MRYEQIIEKVKHRAGFTEDEDAERALDATMSVVVEQMSQVDAEILFRQLPERFQTSQQGTSEKLENAEDFYARVATREGVDLGYGMEHAQAVSLALQESLDEEGCRRLRSSLPDELIELLDARPQARVVERHTSGNGHTLADGRPGSRRPISEADVAQRESLAASDNPHEETKLSTTKGTAQERRKRTLADGKPGSSRSVSDMNHP